MRDIICFLILVVLGICIYKLSDLSQKVYLLEGRLEYQVTPLEIRNMVYDSMDPVSKANPSVAANPDVVDAKPTPDADIEIKLPEQTSIQDDQQQ